MHYISKDRIQVSELKYRELSTDDKKRIEQKTCESFEGSKLGLKWLRKSVDVKAIGSKEGLALIAEE